METELSFAKQHFCYGSHHFWVMSYGNRKLSCQKRQSKRPLELVWTNFFGHSIFITHHSSLKTPCLFGTITHFPSLNIFHTICGPYTCHQCSFFIFFFQYPNSLNPVEKKNQTRTDRTSEEKKKKESNSQPKKKKTHYWVNKRWSKVAAVNPLCVFNYNIAIELWVMETENTFGNWKQPKCVFNFHNS